MEIAQSIILGLIQGITEFLPVSSTAHLFLIPWLFSWQDQGLPFTVALHVGSLFAILYCFREELVLIMRDFFCGLRSFSFEGRQDGKTGVYLIIATLPAVVTGFLFESYASGVLRDPLAVAAFLLGFGALLYISDRKTAASKTLRDMNLADALFFGVAQAFAILPGASRAGVTITGGLFRNYRREEAARFSFLLGHTRYSSGWGFRDQESGICGDVPMVFCSRSGDFFCLGAFRHPVFARLREDKIIYSFCRL